MGFSYPINCFSTTICSLTLGPYRVTHTIHIRLPRQILPYPPAALLLQWEQKIDPSISAGVHAYALALANHPAVLECVPGYASLLVRYAPPKTSVYALEEYIFSLRPASLPQQEVVQHQIPVCYEPSLAPDLVSTAILLDLEPEELVKLHTQKSYLVYQLGYLPGFAFMGQTEKRLKVPRLASPRARVPAGAVGIAGRQTGVYPLESPGGWRLIGRCPWSLLREGHDFSRFRAGDHVQFRAVSKQEFAKLQKSPSPWPER